MHLSISKSTFLKVTARKGKHPSYVLKAMPVEYAKAQKEGVSSV